MTNQAMKRVLDLLYPPKCIVCHKILSSSMEAVCLNCLNTMPEYDGVLPKVQHAQQCVATFFYEGFIRESFLRFKFEGQKQYAHQYGIWMAQTISDRLTGEFDLISWVPVSKRRKRERGYDQTQLLCSSIGQVFQMTPICTLEKHTDTIAQSLLTDHAQRIENVAGVYAPVDPSVIRDQKILLIDDIITTGATMAECCKVLINAGAKTVVCAALAAPRRG